MTATILYCLLTLIIGLLITMATYEAYIYARPRVISWLNRMRWRWINRKFHHNWEKRRGNND